MTSEERFWKCLQLGEEIHKKINASIDLIDDEDYEFEMKNQKRLGKPYLFKDTTDYREFSLNDYYFGHIKKSSKEGTLADVIHMCEFADEIVFSNYGNNSNIVTLNVKVKKEELV